MADLSAGTDAAVPHASLLDRMSGVRIRATLGATLVVAVVLAAAAAAFVMLQRRQLEAALAQVAAQQAEDIAAQVARDGPAGIDVAGSAGGEQAVVQVVTSDGVVTAASPSIAGEPPVVSSRPAPGASQTELAARLPIGDEEKFVVVTRGVTTPSGEHVVVIAAQSLESVERATQVVVSLLTAGYPLLLVLVATTSYWLTGRALAPVEAMRRQVAGISASDLSARVPVPPSGDEIAHLAGTMNAMLDRLQSAAQAQRRFVADASHELRSPLTAIRAAHEVAAIHPATTDWEETTAHVLAEADRLDRLVTDMLLLARADEYGLTLRLEEVDLDDVLSSEAARLRRSSNLAVQVHVPPVRVLADRHHLARAVRNLADNAARHARTRIELRLQADDAHARIEVIDDGPGIPPADRQRVFERFVRLDDSRQRGTGGTGLGLPIARQIARAHGGELTVADHPSGARLLLTIPLQAAPGS